jgi:hypothetical protein
LKQGKLFSKESLIQLCPVAAPHFLEAGKAFLKGELKARD